MEEESDRGSRRVDSVGFGWSLISSRPLNRLRIASATALFDAGSDLIDATGSEPIAGGALMLVAQATRAHHTFEAVISAASMGRGVQAAMLNRSLYDDALDIHWTAANLDDAPELADQHDRFIALAEHELEASHDQAKRNLTVDEQAELGALITAYGGPRRAFLARWHRASAEECLELVHERWKSEPDAEALLDYLFGPTQKRNNLMLHGSPTSYRQTFADSGNGKRTLNRAGPDPRWTFSLAEGAGAYYLVMRLLAAEFNLDRRVLEQTFVQTTGSCRLLDHLPDVSLLPPTAACPCRSGLKVADCHGLSAE
jgi:hypothetical protein